MPVFIKDPNSVPKEGWRYPSIEGSRETDIRASAYANLYRLIVSHYEANGKTPPTQQDVDRWLCENLTVHCFSDGTEFRNNYTNREDKGIEWREVPRNEWPVWAKAIAIFARESDHGLGDTIEHSIGEYNSGKFKDWYLKIFGKSCNCDLRKEKFNSQYPYHHK